MQLKLGRADMDQLLRKTFKPITEPLEELDSTLKQEVRSLKEPLNDVREPLLAAKTESSEQSSHSQPHQASPFHEYLYTFNVLPRTYIRGFIHDTSNSFDTTFGPILEPHTNLFKMGNSVINFSGVDIVINDEVYTGTDVVNGLHRAARRNFVRRRVIIKGLDDLWQADLMEFLPYVRENNGYKYVLIVIDCFSKYLWSRALKDKSANEVKDAMGDILL
ncbi:hypothetical protein Trydic_g23126 [Trypoxylus dichotomus]